MEAVSRLYDRYEDARAAVEALVEAGIDRASVSIISPYNNQPVDENWLPEGDQNAQLLPLAAAGGATLGGGAGAVLGLVLGYGLVALPMVGPATEIGPWASAVVGLVLGGAAGAIAGALTLLDPPSLTVNENSRALRPAKAMVLAWVPPDRVDGARDVMDRFSPIPGKGPRLRPRLSGGLRR